MSITKIKNGLSYELNGCKYISIKGNPSERGYAYGYLVAEDFKEIQKMMKFNMYESYGRTWDYFIDAGKDILRPTIEKEFPEYFQGGLFGRGQRHQPGAVRGQAGTAGGGGGAAQVGTGVRWVAGM